MEKEALNLEENKEGYIEGFGGKKGKGGVYDYIIISKIKQTFFNS